ncbi:hypothetical protein C8R45DRAFT_201312 [Mycena sanguinolenta]|nr:hypothetical protein C8R45DRAFT_201312 [Mycena sanguinolenta]
MFSWLKRRPGGNSYYFGGRGGSGGDSRNGGGGAGGQGTGASLSLENQTRNLSMNNHLHIDRRSGNYFATVGNRRIHILHHTVALAAFHDSAESFPQPKCHPETRTQMLDDLRTWALATDPETTTLWLYGPAGAGKSAIMQVLARQLQDTGRLGGCFFFKRGHATRGSGQDVFSTIAYQLALNCPALRASISHVVEQNPSITELSIATQMKTLISDPWGAHTDLDSITVLIDGLDECDRHDIQEEILRAILNSSFKHTVPLRFIVASRPEPHIREMFDSTLYFGHHRSLNVEQSFEDVRKYLRDEFARIHRDHCTMVGIPLPWPSCDQLEDLVDKSSGHFIYAATIIKFIDDKNYRPTQRLAIVLDGGHGSELAFDALDQLYMTILASAPRQAELAPILCAIANFDLTAADIDQLFGLADGETRLLLRGLHSVLQVPSDNDYSIHSHHASFLDFLNNHCRSHHFYVGSLDHRMDLARPFLRLCARRDHRNWPRIYHDGSRHPHFQLIPFLTSLPPSAELWPQIAHLEPDSIFALDSDNFGTMLSWLKMIPSAPQDLIQLWEDYVYMTSFMSDPYKCSWKHIVSPNAELCQVLVARVLLHYEPRPIRRILGIPWSELRTVMCSVRPNIGSGEQSVVGTAEHVLQALVPVEIQRWTCRDIALKCIGRMAKDDGIDNTVEWVTFGSLLKFCPPCPILYRELNGIPRPVIKSRLKSDLSLIGRIFEWLESFHDSTLELVAFWKQDMLP